MENQEIMVKTRLTLAGRTYILSVLAEEEPIFQQLVVTINEQLAKMQNTYPRYDKQDFLANLLFNKSLELYKNNLALTAYKNSSSINADSSIVPTPVQSHDLELEAVNDRLDAIRDLLAQSLQTN